MTADFAALEQLRLDSRGCPACRLSASRTQVVFADGPPTAKLLLVGEAPGGDEDRFGRPFVGRAGQLLDKILAAVEIKREDVYVTNIVKCRPPGNRTPEPDEIAACERWLLPQLALLRPTVIVTLGNTPTRYFLRSNVGITRARGVWHRWQHPQTGWEAPILPMFHPAYLLRNDTREVGGPKSLTWRDIREVKAVLTGEKHPFRDVPKPDGVPQGGLFE